MSIYRLSCTCINSYKNHFRTSTPIIVTRESKTSHYERWYERDCLLMDGCRPGTSLWTIPTSQGGWLQIRRSLTCFPATLWSVIGRKTLVGCFSDISGGYFVRFKLVNPDLCPTGCHLFIRKHVLGFFSCFEVVKFYRYSNYHRNSNNRIVLTCTKSYHPVQFFLDDQPASSQVQTVQRLSSVIDLAPHRTARNLHSDVSGISVNVLSSWRTRNKMKTIKHSSIRTKQWWDTTEILSIHSSRCVLGYCRLLKSARAIVPRAFRRQVSWSSWETACGSIARYGTWRVISSTIRG